MERPQTLGHLPAVPLFQRAVDIDPQFATAWAWLGRTYGAVGESGLAAEAIRRAWELRDRASEQERFYIDFSYDRVVTGNLEKAVETCKRWAQSYPRDPRPLGFLGSGLSMDLGQFEQGADADRKELELDPGHPMAYANLAGNYVFLNRLADAEATLQRASQRKLDIPDFLVYRFYIAFLKDDPAEMQRVASLAQQTPELEDWILDQQAAVLAYSGHLREARKFSQRAIDIARKRGRLEAAAQHEAGAAVREALFGYAPGARQRALSARNLSDGRYVEYGAALAVALSGEPARAQSFARDLETRFPDGTLVKFSYLPVLHALVELDTHDSLKAIDLLQQASRYEMGWPGNDSVGFVGSLYPVYVRGLAYLAAHRGPEAAQQFQRIADNPQIALMEPIGALARLELGRAFAMAQDTTNAKNAYRDFLNLWKDADPDIPILKQARAEYALLY